MGIAGYKAGLEHVTPRLTDAETSFEILTSSERITRTAHEQAATTSHNEVNNNARTKAELVAAQRDLKEFRGQAEALKANLNLEKQRHTATTARSLDAERSVQQEESRSAE